jgi:hypothetical protein
MRTFAQKPKATQQTTSAKSTLLARTHLGQSREVNSLLHLQRTIGNQAVQRLLQTRAGELEATSSSLASSRFAHDFSRIPVHSSQVRAHAAPKEPPSLRSRDLEVSEGAERRGMDREPPGPSQADTAPTRTHGSTLPHREATELLDCVRIMGEANAAYCRQQVLGEAPPPPLSVTVPNHVRSASTPSGMPDRIPPRVNTPVAVQLSGWQASMPPVTLSVQGAGAANGTVKINGANSVNLTASATVQLRGVDQTTPSNAGNLKLVARQGTTQLAGSSGFSVSSVPQNWSTSLVSSITDSSAVGMVALNSWQSDSNDITDLDEVKRKEQVEVTTATGPWAGAVQGVSSWRDATMGSIQDNHRDSPRASFRAIGSKIAKQVFVFKCARTAVTDIPATNSGLLITRNVTSGGTGVFNYDISKVGTAVTANGFSSGAASGSAVAPTQVV